MKVIIFDTQGTEGILESFIANGYDEFITYSKINKSYYELNGIKVTELKCLDNESTKEKIEKIRGSLNESFFVVYSPFEDIEESQHLHRNSQSTATLIQKNKRLVGIIFEPEIFDYLEGARSLEREALVKVGQDGEISLYIED